MILIVAEKPSVAKDIAAVVGADQQRKGHREGNGYLVSWCIGHLVDSVPPEAYNPALKKWSLDSLPILPDPFRTMVLPDTKSQFDRLVELMRRSDVESLICATDAGREGENIFRLVYEQAGCRKPWKRLWTSSMEASAIRSALNSMKDGHDYDRLADAARCRMQADWLFGMNLTRLYTVLYDIRLPTGRVQSPTLAMIVQRQQIIDDFKPTPYYTVTLRLADRFSLQHRFDSEQEAKACIAVLPETVTLSNVEHKRQSVAPPRLYHLPALQQEANRLFGSTANRTLAELQGLYEEHLATYPRTDSRYITEDMEQPTLKLIAQIQERGLLPHADSVDLRRTVNSAKVNDHPALLPTASLTKERFDALPTIQRNLMTLLLYRLLEAGAGAYECDAVTVEAEVNGVTFSVSEKVPIEPGWRQWRDACLNALGIQQKPSVPLVLTDIDEGDELPVTGSKQDKGMTKPPQPYTEASLLSAMETAGRSMDDPSLRDAMRGKGLGTAATRASIIESLVKNGYVVRKGRSLLPTEKAKTFCSVLVDELKDPELTARWEAKLLEIEQGNGSPEQFMAEVESFLSRFVAGIRQRHDPVLYDGVFSNTAKSGREVIGKCPLCDGDVVSYPKSFACANYKDNGCRFSIWKEIAGKEVTASMAQTLLSKGKTRTMKGFTSKSGKLFEASLELNVENGQAKVNFRFPTKKGGQKT